MSINWTVVLNETIAAARNVLGTKWSMVGNAVTIQAAALIDNARFIVEHKDEMSESEFATALKSQQRAMEAVIAGNITFSILIAEQAADAALEVVLAAVATVA